MVLRQQPYRRDYLYFVHPGCVCTTRMDEEQTACGVEPVSFTHMECTVRNHQSHHISGTGSRDTRNYLELWLDLLCNFKHNSQLGFWTSVYIWSKFLWLVDVAFFIVKKKTLTPVRLYHHVSLLAYCWFAYANAQGLCRWLATLNSFTTFFFYAVPFFISANQSVTRIAMQFMIFVSLLEVFISYFKFYFVWNVFRK